MKVKLTLGEKLKDLRVERKLTLDELEKETGIPSTTLQSFESDNELRIGYQDLTRLCKYYNVSADYLFDLTDHRQYRNIDVDKLLLSDEAIAVLTGEKINNRLLSEIVAHPDFPQFMRAMEVYVDRRITPLLSVVNTMYKSAESAVREKFTLPQNDEVMTFLEQSVIDEDDYLSYRVSEKINVVIKSLFDAHKKDREAAESREAINDIKETVKSLSAPVENADRSKLYPFAKTLGLNLNNLDNEEIFVLEKALKKSKTYKNAPRKF